ncbi:MAG: site-specific integrase [Muribaculaceae bacterium]|nr:site-specific integrase [Muribaculaceae bacterium]
MLTVQIRTKSKDGVAPLYTRLKINDKAVWINLHLNVDVQKWAEASVSDRKIANFLDRLDYARKLSEIEFEVKELRRHHRLTKDALDEVIKRVVFAEVREQLIKDEDIEKQLKERQRKDVKRFVKEYVEGIEKGEILNTKNKKYSKNSIKSWTQFRRLFLDCYKGMSFTWDEMTQSIVQKFMLYLDKHQYMGETKNRHIGIYSTLISVAEKEKLHNNGVARKWLHTVTVTDDDRRARIYLTMDELKALYSMPLIGLQEVVRDWFLIGCYTSLRYDEFSKIEPGCIGYTIKGNKVIRIKQGKVNSKVVIPIINDELETLLEKYNYSAPKLNEQVMNRYLKDICKELAKTEPSLGMKMRTLLTKTERKGVASGKMEFEYDSEGFVVKPRWQLISCHTARRTCITNMYLSGKFSTRQIMSVSGHKKEDTFLKYVRLSLDEKADDVAMAAADGLF